MEKVACAVCAVALLFVFTQPAFSENGKNEESKWQVYAGAGYHHSYMKHASDPAVCEVGVRYQKGKGSLGLGVLHMQQKVHAEDFKNSTDIDMFRYMTLFGYNMFDDVWLDIGPSVTFFQCTDDAKNDFGRDLTMPAQPGGIIGFSYRKHIVNSWSIDLAARSTFGNWEIRGPYGQPANHLRGWEGLFNLKYSF